MSLFTLQEIALATGGTIIQGDLELPIEGIVTDTRKVKQNELFVALKGEKFDGHSFLTQAIQAGATAVLVSEATPVESGIGVIKVLDTLSALGAIAHVHRQRFAIPVVAITGSNGKTTTKDLILSILAQAKTSIGTEGNFNNEIGLPLTLLKLNFTSEVAVVELGMRGLGQIAALAEIAAPNFGVVTNVGLTHLELLGTQANIALAKQELIQAIPADGLAILNGDDPYVRAMGKATKARVVYYGLTSNPIDYRAEIISFKENGSHFRINRPQGSLEIELSLPGEHNVLNTLAAVAVATELGLTDETIQAGLANLELTGKRLHRIEANGYTIIDDTYNSSPTSLKAALSVLASFGQKRRKIAVLADMLELGSAATELHYECGHYAGELGIDHLLAYGELGKNFKTGFDDIFPQKGEYFLSKNELIINLKQSLRPDDVVLIKGSRGMKMEEVVVAITERMV